MFSYRHAFHAGNHADVLKHTILISVLKHLTEKEVALTVVDTHAGAGVYRLDSKFAKTSGESAEGIAKILAISDKSKDPSKAFAPALVDYVDMIKRFNPEGGAKIYPGSPLIIQSLLRVQARDKLKLFELHSTDFKALDANMAALNARRQVAVTRQDGFEGLKALLPPPSRRGMVLIDPSYELKGDYSRVIAAMQDSMKRFATGTYMIWYPVIARLEAHALPGRLKSFAGQNKKPWINATLDVGDAIVDPNAPLPEPGEVQHLGLRSSAVFIINPPYTLKAELQTVLPQMVSALGRGSGKTWKLDSGG
jgi:23S rRNA (adenine2030-N6)-methyltransferase